jgi:putative transposase
VLLITELLTVVSSEFSAANLHNFSLIIESILGISHRVTTLSVARYSGLSARTMQRFYALKQLDWSSINFLLFQHYFYQAHKSYLLVGDETVQAKAGKKSHGLGRFYSSLAKQVIPSVSFLAMSLIDVEKETSYLLATQQLLVFKKL